MLGHQSKSRVILLRGVQIHIDVTDCLHLGVDQKPFCVCPFSFQFYDMYASFLKYFPGPHTKIYDILEDMRKFIERRVKENQATLDPNSPRDFIDCFLVQMEKVQNCELRELSDWQG